MIGKALTVVGGIISGFGAVLGFILSPIGIIVAAIAGLALAWHTNFLGIRDTLEPFINGFLQGIVNFVTGTVIPGLDKLRMWFVEQALPAILGFIQSTVMPAIKAFFTFLSNAWAVVGPALNMIANWFIQDMMPAILTFITTAVIPAFQALFSFIGSAWAIIGPALGQLATWFMQDALPAILGFISGTVVPAVTTFIQILTRVWTDVSPFLLKLLDWVINTGFPLIIDFIENVVVPIVTFLIDTIAGIWDIVDEPLGQLYEWFITSGLPAIMSIIESGGEMVQGLIDILSGIWNTVEPFLTLFRDGIQGIFEFIANTVIQPVIDLIEGIVGVVETVSGQVSGAIGGIGDVVSGIGNFVQDPLGTAGSFVGNTIGSIFSRDNGGPGVAGTPYAIGASQTDEEIFIPRTNGNFIPNAVTQIAAAVRQEVGAGGQGGGPVINFSGTINANSYEEGREAYRGFRDEFMEELQTDGT